MPNLIQINTIGSRLVLHFPKSAFAMEEARMLSHDHPDGVPRSSAAFPTSPARSSASLGYLFGPIYARWCIRQMVEGARAFFAGHLDAR
jgi:hypothetical protein